MNLLLLLPSIVLSNIPQDKWSEKCTFSLLNLQLTLTGRHNASSKLSHYKLENQIETLDEEQFNGPKIEKGNWNPKEVVVSTKTDLCTEKTS